MWNFTSDNIPAWKSEAILTKSYFVNRSNGWRTFGPTTFHILPLRTLINKFCIVVWAPYWHVPLYVFFSLPSITNSIYDIHFRNKLLTSYTFFPLSIPVSVSRIPSQTRFTVTPSYSAIYLVALSLDPPPYPLPFSLSFARSNNIKLC